jgi:hypothetical protein
MRDSPGACVERLLASFDNPGLPGKTLCAMDERIRFAILM